MPETTPNPLYIEAIAFAIFRFPRIDTETDNSEGILRAWRELTNSEREGYRRQALSLSAQLDSLGFDPSDRSNKKIEEARSRLATLLTTKPAEQVYEIPRLVLEKPAVQ